MEQILEYLSVIIVPLAFLLGFLAMVYFAHREGVKRMELLHKERIAAMEKGIPLPELPSKYPTRFPERKPISPEAPLIVGILLATVSLGIMLVLFLTLPFEVHRFWVVPVPVAFAGVGLILYYFLRNEMRR